MKQLTAYIIDGHDVRIRPAPVERQWMDDSDRRFAYRCLPLNIANAHGWELLCTTAFSAIWDGGKSLDSVHVTVGPDATPSAISHFGSGILTFHVPCLFRTDPGIDLYATGPVNRPKDGIAALSGIIETDWSPYTFTMNWLFTRAVTASGSRSTSLSAIYSPSNAGSSRKSRPCSATCRKIRSSRTNIRSGRRAAIASTPI